MVILLLMMNRTESLNLFKYQWIVQIRVGVFKLKMFPLSVLLQWLDNLQRYKRNSHIHQGISDKYLDAYLNAILLYYKIRKNIEIFSTFDQSTKIWSETFMRNSVFWFRRKITFRRLKFPVDYDFSSWLLPVLSPLWT